MKRSYAELIEVLKLGGYNIRAPGINLIKEVLAKGTPDLQNRLFEVYCLSPKEIVRKKLDK